MLQQQTTGRGASHSIGQPRHLPVCRPERGNGEPFRAPCPRRCGTPRFEPRSRRWPGTDAKAVLSGTTIRQGEVQSDGEMIRMAARAPHFLDRAAITQRMIDRSAQRVGHKAQRIKKIARSRTIGATRNIKGCRSICAAAMLFRSLKVTPGRKESLTGHPRGVSQGQHQPPSSLLSIIVPTRPAPAGDPG